MSIVFILSLLRETDFLFLIHVQIFSLLKLLYCKIETTSASILKVYTYLHVPSGITNCYGFHN